ncbi:SCP2 sterol-binding domain-containing protein [Actinocrispum sp. NPDC049592]|uniref:SCP2 sterol-binding domain-containing protein n=1 Tax=Actinocrispum sp. NPDC049592 TaxID=3154835 RepID=UPI003439837F
MVFRRARPGADPGVFDAFARSIDMTKLEPQQFVRLIETMDMLGKAGTGVELSALSTSTFVSIIAQASSPQLDALMEHAGLRTVVLNEIFTRMSQHLHPGKVAGLNAVLHWRFTGGYENGGFDRFQTVIENGTCVSGTVQDRDPRATVTLAPTDFLRVSTGISSAPLLFIRGRVKVKGDIPFAAGFANYFDIPQP